MENKEFTEIVREQGGLESRQESERVTRAALLTLSESLFGYEAQNLALYLPEDLRGTLRRSAENRRLDLEVFLERFAERAALSPEQSVLAIQAVFTALKEALPAQEIENLVKQLPDDYAPLLQPPSQPRTPKGHESDE